ncbi:hypothetical protein DCS_07299 [Drechmeria coniospora]|uniref:Uncharacterized protein n=1 Tax=Drechmeria coniospora TaxID=98403 RepID=A0A151GE22_DRECN|nr:hypothetical protein DCS_07299 [Drechmeria coniospora]KYK55336.1 hypothetical protein DCS_07299 [Drechmeria coniospora]
MNDDDDDDYDEDHGGGGGNGGDGVGGGDGDGGGGGDARRPNIPCHCALVARTDRKPSTDATARQSQQPCSVAHTREWYTRYDTEYAVPMVDLDRFEGKQSPTRSARSASDTCSCTHDGSIRQSPLGRW